jgi:hypothetical protein
VLILGVTADDKGAQLEALVAKILETEGYVNIRLNRIDTGGNELDVTAERETSTVGETQRVYLIGEAKAYQATVNMPAWQRFLGKLFLARFNDPATAGVLVALNGVNGPVAGSYKELRRRDTQITITEGSGLEQQLTQSGEIAPNRQIREAAARHYRRQPESLEPAFYGGAFFWIIRWPLNEYAILDGHGDTLITEHIETLRPALENVLDGTLLLPDEAQQRAESAHRARLALINALFTTPVALTDTAGDANPDEAQAVEAFKNEPFTTVTDNKLALRAPARPRR